MSLRIYASYVPVTDKYVADISADSMDIVIEKENGADLVDAVKKETGIEIEYNHNNRTFIVPEVNRFN